MIRTELICSVCGNIQIIYRKAYSQKETGHIKDLWCPTCKNVKKFIEIKDRDICYNKLLMFEYRTPLENYILDLLIDRKERRANEKTKYIK